MRRSYGIEGEHVLAVGSIQPRKNLVRLVRAYSLLIRERGRSNLPKLVLAGRQAWLYGKTLKAIEDDGVGGSVILAGHVSAGDLPALYTGATCSAYPSYFEGFGLPPLKAMRCGTPALVGDRASLPEVVGDAALTADPFDAGAIARAPARLIDDDALRAELRARGLRRASAFDWRDTARMTLQVYRKIQEG